MPIMKSKKKANYNSLASKILSFLPNELHLMNENILQQTANGRLDNVCGITSCLSDEVCGITSCLSDEVCFKNLQ